MNMYVWRRNLEAKSVWDVTCDIVVAWWRGKGRCDIISLHSSDAPVGLAEDLPKDAHMSWLGRDQWGSAAAPGISGASGAECMHSACSC